MLDWCTREAIPVIPYGGGSSVVGGVEPRFDGPAVTVDVSVMSSVLEIDRRQPGRADPGRGARAVDRAAVAPTRSDVAALPAILRLLQPRRLAGHPRRWPLRHPLHPHRRPGRVVARGHPGRDQRVASAAGIRRRPVSGPAVRRLRGHAGHHHRGVDAVAKPPAMAGHGFGGVRRLGGRGRGDAGDRAVRALPGQLPLAGPGRGVPERRHHGQRRAAGARFRIGGPSDRPVAGPGRRDRRRARRHRDRPPQPRNRKRHNGKQRCRAELALGFPAHALSA